MITLQKSAAILIVCLLPESLPNSTIRSCENLRYFINQISTSFSKIKEPHQNSRRRRSDTNQVMRVQKYHVPYALTHSLTHLLTITPRSRVLLEKLTGSQLVKQFSTFYGTQMFFTVFTSARHLSLF